MPVQYSWAPDVDDELSDLTDIEDDEEPASPPPPPLPSTRRAPEPRAPSPPPRAKSTRPTTQSATETSKQRMGKGAQPLRRPPRSVTFSVSALYDLIKAELIDLDPEYQRGVVWTDKKQSELINSIVDNYYVPPIVLSVSRSSDGGETRVCIDGKQRLTSICQFMDGEIPYKDSVSNRKVHYINTNGSRRKMLTDKQQSTFRNKQITCMEYDDLTPEEEREIFQRVQLGVSLSPADRLPALNGPYADLVREMRRRIESTQGFSGYLDWGKARGKDFQALGQSVYLIVYGKTAMKADPTPIRLETFLGQTSATKNFDALKIDAFSMVEIYCRIAGDDRLGKYMRKDLTPYEFTMALYLISQYSKKLSDTQLSDAMGRMRRDYKQKFKNKKPTPTATTVFKHLVAFVRKTVPDLLCDLKDSNPSMGPAFGYRPVAEPLSPPVTKGRRKQEPIVQKNGADVDMSDSQSLGVVAGKRERVVSPPPTDVDPSDADTESDDDKVVSKKKVRESAAGSSKPKSALAAPRKSAKTVVKRSRSATAKPVSSAPAPSTSKAQPVVEETKAGVKGKASATVKAPSLAASAQLFDDTQTQRAQPSRPLNAVRSLPEASPTPNAPVTTRMPLPTRVTGHQQTPSIGAPTPPTSAPSPSASGSGAGRSPAIPASTPRSLRQLYAPAPAPVSAFATPLTSPSVPHHVPAILATPPMEVPPPYSGMGSTVMLKAPFQKPKPQAKKPVLWLPPGTDGSPKESTPRGAPNAPNPQVQQQHAGLTTASRLKAQMPEMFALGGSSNKRGAPDHGNWTELKRRRTGDGIAELGVGQPQNASATDQQRRATVHVPPVQIQQQSYNQHYTPPPSAMDNPRAGDALHTPRRHGSSGSTTGGGSLFSPPSGSSQEELMPGIESLNIQSRESQTHGSWR